LVQAGIDPWCVLLASREDAQRPASATPEHGAALEAPPAMIARDPLAQTLRRAATVSPIGRIGAVIAEPARHRRLSAIKELPVGNIFVQPKHQGTAYEVLLALLLLEGRVAATTPIIFLPCDHVVSDEEVMTRSLVDMLEWISDAPQPVYLLGTVPEGPHDQLGYVVPWHAAPQMPTSVYEFVEHPDVLQARKLINAGGLWNTFIFGGTWLSILQLFRPRFDATIAALRSVLNAKSNATIERRSLAEIYDRVTPVDFSRDVLATQVGNLNVLRLPRCGWWPMKSPKRVVRISDASTAAVSARREAGEAPGGNTSRRS
jgi:mannose-1-phosphate guanylyltransferase